MSMKQFFAIGLTVVMIWGSMGCQTMSEHKIASGAGIGAVAGGVVGGIIGAQSGNAGKGVAIGAATGAALGGGIGWWMDRQAKKYQKIQDVQVEKVPESKAPAGEAAVGTPEPAHVTLRISSEMLFDKDSSALKPYGDQKLREIAQVMNEDKDSNAVVKGYASSEGADDYNLRLSENRAKVVANTLVGYGVDPGRVTALGMGESHPIGDNATESGRAQNRRVEIEIFPKNTAR
jgi:outer membrane protein OmpA-like peptidoglycan-associated protein